MRRFETLYVSDSIRIAKDSRNDTIVLERDGPPRDVSLSLS